MRSASDIFRVLDSRPTEDGYDPRAARIIGRAFDAVTRVYFRYQFRGAERVPEGPCLFVGNHSGIGIADAVCMMGAQQAHLPDRRIVAMMHDLFINAPVIGHVSRAFGAVPAHREAAREALGRGHDVMACPGGGLDSCRPVTEPRKVVFGPRRGYVHLALETGVPVVPVATIGSHYSYLLLPIGDAVARLIRLRKWTRDERLPIPLFSVIALPIAMLVALGLAPAWWLALALILLVMPNPVRITSEVLPPIDVARETAHIADPAERVEAAHQLVHGALQRAVAAMSHHEPLDYLASAKRSAKRAGPMSAAAARTSVMSTSMMTSA